MLRFIDKHTMPKYAEDVKDVFITKTNTTSWGEREIIRIGLTEDAFKKFNSEHIAIAVDDEHPQRVYFAPADSTVGYKFTRQRRALRYGARISSKEALSKLWKFTGYFDLISDGEFYYIERTEK